MIPFPSTGGIPRPKPVTPEGGSIRRSHIAVGLAVTLIATAFCLRAPFTCVGPLADVIQSDLGISSGAMGTITTIPLLMFAAFSVVMGDLGRRHPAGHVMVLGLAMVLSGVLCRSLLGTYGLFLGTAVVGIGITAGNFLIPAFIKAHYPERIGRLTGIYTAMMSLMSAVAGAVSVPIGDAVGWRGSLLVWAVLVAVVLLMWVPHRDAGIEEGVPEAGSRRSLLSSPTTWFIALYLGLQSLIYYAMVAWMAVILQSKGLDPSEAGVVVSVYMVVGIAGSILLPAITGIRRDLRAVGASLGAMYIVGLALLQLSSGSPASLAAPVLLCGLCGGACITYPSMLFGLRTKTSGDSSSVSGIAQSVGYLVAAVGPVAVGAMHDAASDWGPGILFLVCVAASLVVLGYLIGRDVVIGAPEA